MRQLLSELAEIGAGQGAPQGDTNYCDDGVPFVKAGNLQDLTSGSSLDDIQKVSEDVAKAHKLKLYPKGTILFAKSGMSCLKGYVYVLPRKAYVVSHLACITPKEKISDYLRYYFIYNKPYHLVKDTSYPSISLTNIGNLEIDIKNSETREHITSVLRNIERVIDFRKEELKKLDDLIKARFIEMFGDPITNTKGIETKDLKDVLVLKAGDFTVASDISDTPTEEYKYPCYGGNGIRGYVTEYNQEGGYSLIGRQGALSGNVQYATGQFKNTEHALLVTPIIKTNSIWLNQLLINLDLKRYQTGAAQPGLSVKNLQKIQIISVPMEEQSQFAKFVVQVDKSKVAVQKALDEAQLLFDNLMQQYFG